MNGRAKRRVASSRPLIIPFFIPHMGCPHQCVFCNQQTITSTASPPLSEYRINDEVNRYLRFAKKNHTAIQISFFGGNFLGIAEKIMHRLLGAATAFVDQGKVDSLRCSTRPDTISRRRLDMLADFPIRTVELGVQSMNDAVLDAAGRGHTAADSINAASQLKAAGYQVGLQMMVGLPGEDDDGAIHTARRIIALQPDFVRIYPTLVLAGSPLADRLGKGTYQPMTLDHGVTLVKRLYLMFKAHDIPVVRMGLQASDGLADPNEMLAGPYHPAFGHLVHGEIARDAICGSLDSIANRSEKLTLTAHPAMVSRVQGLNKRNIHYFRQHYGIRDVILRQDDTLASDQLIVNDRQIPLYI